MDNNRMKDKLLNHAKRYSQTPDDLKRILTNPTKNEIMNQPRFDEITMPYGKHKGTAIGDLPTGYLRWVAENFNDERICAAADMELQYREEGESINDIPGRGIDEWDD